jgi:uroporphyrinogen-III decarboxylase
MLPRTTGLFESFKKLPSLRMSRGEMWVNILADPDIHKTFETLMKLADVERKYRDAHAEMRRIILSRGYPSLLGFGLMLGAPFDHFADLLRGTKGISLDLFRQPEKLKEGMQMMLDFNLKRVKDFPMTASPVCAIPLHKGDDVFMSRKQFEKFYWPGLKKVIDSLIAEGIMVHLFAEGAYNQRLDYLADFPKGWVSLLFDKTDMAAAKKAVGDKCCISGNVPASLMVTGTPREVKENCRRLIETCAPGGGYILSASASMEKGNMENLHAMFEAAKQYGVYK